MANTNRNVKALNGHFVAQYLGKNIYLSPIKFDCPYYKLFDYSSLTAIKAAMRREKKKSECPGDCEYCPFPDGKGMDVCKEMPQTMKTGLS